MPGPKLGSVLDTFRASSTGDVPATTLANEQGQNTALVDLSGRLWARLHDGAAPISPANPLPVGVVPAPPSFSFVNQGPAESGLVTTGVLYLHKFVATNVGQSDAWLMFFDQAAAPVGGELPYVLYQLPAGKTLDSEILDASFGIGLAWAVSTSSAQYVLGAGSVVQIGIVF